MQHACEAFFQAIENDPTAGCAARSADAGHSAYQVMKLALDRGQVGEDVGMVELQVVEHRRARPVMHELAALVEERRVVLVCLDHEQRSLVRFNGRAQSCRHAEIQRHAADQKARRAAAVLQNPGQHRCGRGLAMGAGHRQHVAARQHLLGQPLRAAGVG